MSSNSTYERFPKIMVLFLLVIIVFIFALQQLSAPFKEDLKLQDIAGALGALFIIVLLVERVIEIFISIWRNPKSNALKQELDSFSDTDKSSMTIEFKTAQESLAKYKAQTHSTALLIGFSLAIIICSAGVGLLSEILQQLPEKASNGQKSFIRGADILLTAGLIAGGSDAFHQFVNSIVTFFKESKKKLEEN